MIGDAIDTEQFERVLHRLFPQATLLRVWPLSGGLSARMAALEARLPDGEAMRLVVRQPGDLTLRRNPRAAADEYRVLEMTQSLGLPAPAPYALDESGDIFPTPYLVIEYIDGTMDFAPAHPTDYAEQMAAQLARIHQIDGATPALAFLPHQQGGPAEKLAQMPPAPPTDDEGRIRAALDAAGLLPYVPALRHGDFWPGNMLWKESRLAAVVDWEDAEIGDPLADLGISRLDVLMIYGKEAMHAFTQRYRAQAAGDLARLPYWDLYAAQRAGPYLGHWAEGFPALGRPDLTESALRDAHRWFVTQAFDNLPRAAS